MRKKALIILFLIAALLTGCEETSVEVTPTVNTVQMEYSDFDLTVDSKTDIVYIDNLVETWKGEDGWRREYHIYTPYYGKNGKPCKFIDGKVVECE